MEAKNFRPIKAVKPSDKLSEFIGKELLITIGQPEGGKRVIVETIQGSMIKEYVTRFEVNHEHHIVILDAYKQLNKDHSITPEDIEAFDQTTVEHIEPIKESSPIDAPILIPPYNPEV